MKDYLMTLRTTRARIGASLLVASLVLSACSGGGPKPTDVKITAPSPGTAINVGQGTVIQGEANGDNITRVEVVVDGKAYASLSTPDKTKGVANFPVSVPWTPMAAGTHAIQLRAYGVDDKLLGQSEPLVMDAKATVAQVTPTGAAKPTTSAATAAPIATATPSTAGAATATQAPQATSAAQGPSLTVTNDFVNVRSGPAIGYQLLGRLDKGQTAPVRGKSDDGKWWQISYAAGTNGVGWVFGDYVQANAAANNVPVASAPPLPTSPPQPTSEPLPTAPPPTAIAPTTVVYSLPLVGSQGQLHVDQNPIPQNGTVTAYWNVSNISGIWFDKGDGSSYQPAAGSQSVTVSGITSQRTLNLKWKTNSGQEVVDSIVIGISGQVLPTAVVSQNCSSTDPNWRGGNPNYPFCVISDMDWINGGNSIRYFGYQQDITVGVQWNIYGIAGIWLVVEPNDQQCGPKGTSTINQAVSGNANYSWNVKDLGSGGYIVHMKIQRNDNQIVYYNEKFICVGVGQNVATSTPAPTKTNTPAPQPATPTPKPPPAP